MSFNRNPAGHNQHKPIPGADDPILAEALRGYHRENITKNSLIRSRLIAETGITMSVASIKRVRNQLGLYGCRSKASKLSTKEKEQLVLNQLDSDIAQGQGLANIKARIAHDQDTHLSRDFVSGIMHLHAQEGFDARNPGAKRIPRVAKAPIGIHERWAGDGHDKLYRIGFPIWAVVDDATAKWLGAWVVPSNRMGEIIGYLFLCLVEEYQGIPLQFSTDCGSETTQLYGLCNALRQIFFPEVLLSELPAHCYLRSVRNISIERSWLRLRLDFGNNAVEAFEKGVLEGLYNPDVAEEVELCRWLWSKLLRQELATFMSFRNGAKMRKDANKAGPSGCSRNDAFVLHEEFGLSDELLRLTPEQLDIIGELKEAMGGEELLAFVSAEFEAHAEHVYAVLGVASLTMENESGGGTGVRCGKCLSRKPGMSAPEVSTLNACVGRVILGTPVDKFPQDKLQCAGCGVTSSILKQPLCNGCIAIYKNAEHIPISILRLEGVASILLDRHVELESQDQEPGLEKNLGFSNGAMSILESASMFQAKASDRRITTKTTVIATRGAEAGLNKYKNLSKAQAVKEERRVKRAEATLVDVGVRISATLWNITRNGKMAQLNPFRNTKVFSPNVVTKSALDDLLTLIRAPFQLQHPDAQRLTWANITLYAHENQHKYSSLEHFDCRQTIKQFFNEFVVGKLSAESALKDRRIEIRFVFFADVIYPDHTIDDSDIIESGQVSSQAGPKRKRVPSSAQPKESGLLQSSFIRPQVTRNMGPPRPILRSTFIPRAQKPTTWTRDIQMITCEFIRTEASYKFEDGLKVTFHTVSVSDQEHIEVAAQWQKPQDKGYIGEGFTKRGIYARFGGKEYVLTQPIDPQMTHSAAESTLKAEYALLCMGDAFKAEFDRHACESQGKMNTIPAFYFNFQGSIFGEFVPSLTSQSRHLPHRYFIATPLLPCGSLDAKVKKFTGNDTIGDAVDHLTKAIHAFAHFSVVYSQTNILFCDLQGAPDQSGVMCLIDPQAHTASNIDNNCSEYWDGGQSKIHSFLEQHAASCSQNWVCRALNLKTAVVQAKSPEKPDLENKSVGDERAQKKKKTTRGRLSFIVE